MGKDKAELESFLITLNRQQMVTDWEYLATTQANCTDNYSTLDHLVSQGWSGEVRQGSEGEEVHIESVRELGGVPSHWAELA